MIGTLQDGMLHIALLLLPSPANRASPAANLWRPWLQSLTVLHLSDHTAGALDSR